MLSLTFQGESATADAETLKKLAEGRFADVKAELRRVEQTVTLALTFSCSAEKMIFQLENALALVLFLGKIAEDSNFSGTKDNIAG